MTRIAKRVLKTVGVERDPLSSRLEFAISNASAPKGVFSDLITLGEAGDYKWTKDVWVINIEKRRGRSDPRYKGIFLGNRLVGYGIALSSFYQVVESSKVLNSGKGKKVKRSLRELAEEYECREDRLFDSGEQEETCRPR